MFKRIAEFRGSLVALSRGRKVLFLFAAPIGAIALGMLDHPIVAIAWYLAFMLIFTSISKSSTTEETR